MMKSPHVLSGSVLHSTTRIGNGNALVGVMGGLLAIHK